MALWSKKEDKKAEPKAAPLVAAKDATKQAPKNGAAKELSAADKQKRLDLSKDLHEKLGEIVRVLMRAPQFRGLTLAQTEALVLPALRGGQFLVAEARSKTQGFVTPLAAALWASVSAEVDKRLSELDKPMQLTGKEWRSGDIPWLIAMAGDARMIAPMLKKLQEETLKGKPLKMRTKGKDGKMVVGKFSGETAPAAS